MKRVRKNQRSSDEEAAALSSWTIARTLSLLSLGFFVAATSTSTANQSGGPPRVVSAFLPTPSTRQRCFTFTQFKLQLSTSPENEEPPFVLAQEALLSSRRAREIRKTRSSRRGRAPTILVASPQSEQDSTFSHPSRAASSSLGLLAGNSTAAPASNVQSLTATLDEEDRSVPFRVSYVHPLDSPFNVTLEALQAFHQQHGHLVLPRRFVVPSDDRMYPEEWIGQDLSSTVYTMKWWLKHIKQRPERVRQLNALGFVWERLQPEWNLILEAIIVYLQLHGHTRVPINFVVPHDDTADGAWPRSTWGLPLGSCVYRIRSRHDFLRGPNSFSRRQQLERIGFVWDVSEEAFQRFYEALQHYAKLHRMGPFAVTNHKALRVPSLFVVPTNDPAWPKAMWGYPLGERSSAVRSKQLYVKRCARRQKLLEDLGFRFNSDVSWFRVVHAAAIYSQLHGRMLSVPYHFVVPSPSTPEEQEGWPWPEYVWGLKLGQRLKDVRVKGAYLQGPKGVSRRRQLDALGMDWAPKRGRIRVRIRAG